MEYPTCHMYFLDIHTCLSRERCITILYHAIENAVANTINRFTRGARREGGVYSQMYIEFPVF